jgi:hypothetical protein
VAGVGAVSLKIVGGELRSYAQTHLHCRGLPMILFTAPRLTERVLFEISLDISKIANISQIRVSLVKVTFRGLCHDCSAAW